MENSNIIQLDAFKQKKSVQKELSGDRKPLYLSADGKTVGVEGEEQEDFAARIARIRSSLEKINKLMAKIQKKDI